MQLHKVWEFFNELAFNGEMWRPGIFLYKKNLQYVHKGQVVQIYGGYSGFPTRGIWLAKDHDDPSEIYETLYHEMCHQFAEEILGEPDLGHGPEFHKIYNKGIEKLGKKLRRQTAG